MRDAEFAQLSRLVEREAGVALSKGDSYALEARLNRLARSQRLTSVRALLAQAQTAVELRQRICEAVTVHETRFFRDEQVFETIGTSVIPALLAGGRRSLSIWCAASASGQEAVSMAILLRERCPHVPARIVATDLSHAMVERTHRGTYSPFEVRRGLSAARLAQHLEPAGQDFILRRDLRETIVARQLNLAGSWPSFPTFDLVLLRNVLVYLHPEVRTYLLARLHHLLAPDGVLVLGATERGPGDDAGYQRVVVSDTVTYRLRQENR